MPFAYSANDTVPARSPPAGAETVTESFGTQVCALVSEEGTAFTVKHSLADESLEPGMPLAASPLKTARKQYRPGWVTVTTSETTVTG